MMLTREDSFTHPEGEVLPERIDRLINHPITVGDLVGPISNLGMLTVGELRIPLRTLLQQRRDSALAMLRDWLLYHRRDMTELWAHPDDYPHFVIGAALCCLKFTDEQTALVREFLNVRVFRTKSLRTMVLSNWKDMQEHLLYERPELRSALPAELESALYEHFVSRVLQDVRMVRDDCLGLLHTAARNFVLNLLEEVQVRKRHSVPVSGDDEDLNVLEDTALTELAMQARDERLHETDDEIESFLTRLQTEQVLALIKPDLTDHQAQFLDQLLPLLRQDRTVKEAAAEMGISADLAYVHLHKIRKLYKRFSV